MSDSSMIYIGSSQGTIKAASEAIIAVLKAAGTEAASVAAMHALSELARAPTNTSIRDCQFTNLPATRARK
jgi:hypothetical protein